MRLKYVEERFSPYFILGHSSVDDRVNVQTTSGYGFLLHQDEAAVLIADRDAVLDMVWRLSQALDEVAPERFKQIWYG